jgi:hypothetical protein
VPARYRDQAATPAESKSTFNEHEASAPRPFAPAAPPAEPAEAAPPAATRAPVPRIRTDAAEPEKPRMADFEEKPPETTPESPQKYFRDCNSAGAPLAAQRRLRWNEWSARPRTPPPTPRVISARLRSSALVAASFAIIVRQRQRCRLSLVDTASSAMIMRAEA